MGSGGRQAGGLVDAQLAHYADALGVVHESVPCSMTALMTVHQQTPNSAATLDTALASSHHLPAGLGPGPGG